MTNISAMKALAELNRIEAQRNQNEQPVQNQQGGFRIFGFGFRQKPEVIPEQDNPKKEFTV